MVRIRRIALGKKVGLSIPDTRRWGEPLGGSAMGIAFGERRCGTGKSGDRAGEFPSQSGLGGASGGSLEARGDGAGGPKGAESIQEGRAYACRHAGKHGGEMVVDCVPFLRVSRYHS